MTTKLQQHSDECGYALEALGKLLSKYEKKNSRAIVETAVGKNTIEILGDYQKEYRKIEERNEEIRNPEERGAAYVPQNTELMRPRM